MKLKRLELKNFRQFFGTQEVFFAQEQPDNVTVIHGDNGAGKTTLLNAFTWLFYDDVSLPQPDKIATERALAEAEPDGKVRTRVSLEFAHDEAHYTAVRWQVFQKQGADDLAGRLVEDKVELEYIDSHGNHQERKNPNSAMQQILPQRLREIFFFDGEDISELTSDDGQDRVQEAIRNIMGLEILERTIHHLGEAEGRFEDTIKEYGSSELSAIIDEKNECQSQIAAKQKEMQNIKQSQEAAREELEEVNDKLAGLEESGKLQRDRERVEDNIEEVEKDIAERNEEIAGEIAEAGYIPFAMDAVEETGRMLQKKRDKGEIPSDIKPTFVDDLLDIEECICGRPLGHDSRARDEVAGWRDNVGSSELENAAMRIVGRLSEIGHRQSELHESVDTLMDRRGDKSDRRRQLIEQLDEINAELDGIETENIAGLEDRRKELKAGIVRFTEQIGAIKSEIESLEETKSKIEKKRTKAKEKNQTADLARRRAETASYVGGQIEDLFEKFQDKVRSNVNDRVNETFRSVIEKDYYEQIGENYSLKILKDVGDTEEEAVAKSTGERQVASLSFISSLVSLAKERYESDKDSSYFTGGIYPMLMDSPFGYLDPTYQQRISRTLPEMGEQVIVLVTESQWSEAVAGEMAKIAGQRYELDYVADEDYEYTEIVAAGGS